MKTLIIGGSSLLGRYLTRTRPDDCELHLTWYRNIGGPLSESEHAWHQLDVRDLASVKQLFEILRPDVVINCSAIGGVDYARDNYHETVEVNITGAQNVATASSIYNAYMVHISTNAVFRGDDPPYGEYSKMEPVNDYGIIKRQSETIVRDYAERWQIIRPFLLYGWPYNGGRGNWARSIIAKTERNMVSTLVNDNIWMPTYAADVANTMWQLLPYENEIFNVASPERATLYEFGLAVCEVFGLEDKLTPVDSDYFPSLTQRPKDTSYDLGKITRMGIELSSIRKGLERMKDEKNKE